MLNLWDSLKKGERLWGKMSLIIFLTPLELSSGCDGSILQEPSRFSNSARQASQKLAEWGRPVRITFLGNDTIVEDRRIETIPTVLSRSLSITPTTRIRECSN